mgnify:CR=1 FL=1
MKKVLFFLESLAGGGAEKVLTDIVCNLDKSKYDITVCTVADKGVYEEKVKSCCKYQSFIKTDSYNRGIFGKLSVWLKTKIIYKLPANIVYKLFIKDKYDIEIAFIEGFATKFIANSCNPKSKKIAWVHTDMNKNSYADISYSNISNQIKCYKKYDKIICVSNYVKEVFEKKFFKSDSVVVCYNPVDESNILKKASEPCDIKKSEGLLLGTVGRLTEQKGYLRLLKCINEVKKINDDFYLWIIGDGKERPILEEYINQNNLKENVKLLGFHSNPYKYLVCCDVFICSSYAEGFSTAATESLILGKPIFTVECSGMRELFGKYKCGEIVSNTDEALLSMLKKIVTGTYNIKSYLNDIEKRKNDFKLKERIIDIENLLDN